VDIGLAIPVGRGKGHAFVMPAIRDPAEPLPTERMLRQHLPSLANLKHLPQHPHKHFPAGELPGDGVAVGAQADEGVRGHAAHLLRDQGKRRPVPDRLKGRLLLFPDFSHQTMRGGVQTPVGDGVHPAEHLPTEVFLVVCAASGQEAASYVAHAALDFAFGLGPVRAAEARNKAPGAGKVHKERIELHLSSLIYPGSVQKKAAHHRLLVVVEDLVGDAA
jgi:hypothetical protein